MEEEKRELKRLIIEDNVEEFARILNSNENLRDKLKPIRFPPDLIVPMNVFKQPLLLFAVEENSKKVVEYLLSQDFVDIKLFAIHYFESKRCKYLSCCMWDKRSSGTFSIIERKVPHNLLLQKSLYNASRFYFLFLKHVN